VGASADTQEHPAKTPKKAVDPAKNEKPLSEAERRALTLANTSVDPVIRFLPGGDRFVVIGKAKRTVHLFDCKDLSKPIVLMSSAEYGFVSLEVSSRHPLVVGASINGNLQFIDCDVRKEWSVKTSSHDTRGSVALTPDGSLCASTLSRGRGASLFDTQYQYQLDDKPVKVKLKIPDRVIKEVKFPRRVTTTALCLSPDGKHLVACFKGGSFSVLDVKTLKVLLTRQAHEETIECAALSADGKLLLLGGSDQRVTLWNTKTWKLESNLLAHEKSVISVAFSPSGKQFASGCTACTLRLWDTATRKITKTIRPRGAPLSIAFHPKSPVLASASSRIQFWNTETGAETRPPRSTSSTPRKPRK
jgi:WD40 repeat protein